MKPIQNKNIVITSDEAEAILKGDFSYKENPVSRINEYEESHELSLIVKMILWIVGFVACVVIIRSALKNSKTRKTETKNNIGSKQISYSKI